MFENMTETEARQAILRAVGEYADTFHCEKGGFRPGDRIAYASRVYDREEMTNLVDSSLDFWLTAGRFAEKFEKDFAAYLGIRHALLVNSGSSANLLAFMTLTSHLLGDRRIRKGDEVITVACGFPTTIAPIVQFGAVPVFLDVTIPGYDVDVSMLEKALSSKTKAVMMAHTLGNPFPIAEVRDFCDRHGLWLIEDNCDALGSRYTLKGVTKYTGTFGDIGTSSFYPPHHMTMGEGGAVYTDNPLLFRISKSMRDWGRDCICPPGQDNFCGHRFDGRYGELPEGYDHKYVYSHLGYNLKATDMQAAVGCAQLEKFPSFAEKRRENFAFLSEALKGTEHAYILPQAEANSDPCWFGYLITVRGGIRRQDVVRRLEENHIQTRMLFAGNILRHPCIADDEDLVEGRDYRVVGTLANTERIMNDTFWIGVYPGMTKEKLSFMAEVLKEAAK